MGTENSVFIGTYTVVVLQSHGRTAISEGWGGASASLTLLELYSGQFTG